MHTNQQITALAQHEVIYPGHPVTIAFFIMKAFPSLGAAMQREDGASCPAALSSSDVPGARGTVHAALTTLRRALDHGLDDAFAYGDSHWQDETAAGYNSRRDPGQAQADSIKELFRETFRTWAKKGAKAAAA